MEVSFLNLKLLAPLAGALIMGGAIPAMASSHAKASFDGRQHVAVSLPRKASSTAKLNIKTKGQGSVAVQASHKKADHNSTSTKNSAAVKADVATIHSLTGKIQTARLQYVAALKAYVSALSAAMTSANAGSLSTAMTQLSSINTTLAQTVKNEMQAKTSASLSSSTKGPKGLTQVISKFQAELKALQKATAELNSLTAKLSSSGSGSTSGSGSVSGSSSTSVSGS